ncbi:MAG: ferritin family protein [Candidatus Omnitrophica bacterium]|nr:ferritin family protein [Candidatus Omnitrophota bacterium]
MSKRKLSAHLRREIMGNIFAGSELVELGVQIENNGRDFYNTVAKQAKSEKAKEIFQYLAGEEEKHIVVFGKILDSLEKYEPAESYQGEYFTYMNTLASEQIFTQKDKGTQVAQKTKSDQEAIDLGIGFEKDSIIFYEGMRKVIPEYDHKIVDELIQQEHKHLKQLSDLKSSL